jgi:flagellar protein FliL
MPKDAETEETIDADTSAPAPSGGGKRRMMIIVAAAAILLVGAGGGGAYYLGLLDGLLSSEPPAAAAGDESHGGEAKTAENGETTKNNPVFYALPDILVSLNLGERRSTFLKVKINLELSHGEDVPSVEKQMPRIIDFCQVYLRELRLEELRGSAGSLRLREELLRRISAAVEPVPVRDVLFSEMFIQ